MTLTQQGLWESQQHINTGLDNLVSVACSQLAMTASWVTTCLFPLTAQLCFKLSYERGIDLYVHSLVQLMWIWQLFDQTHFFVTILNSFVYTTHLRLTSETDSTNLHISQRLTRQKDSVNARWSLIRMCCYSQPITTTYDSWCVII